MGPAADQSALKSRLRALLAIAWLGFSSASVMATDGPARLEVELLLLEDSGWTHDAAGAAAETASDIFAQCHLQVEFRLRSVEVPADLLDLSIRNAFGILELTRPGRPAVFLIRDSHRPQPFDGEAFGRANTRRRPWLRDTVWVVADARDPGIVLAHELFHVLANSGAHSDIPGNLMGPETSPATTNLEPAQCRRMKQTASAYGFIVH